MKLLDTILYKSNRNELWVKLLDRRDSLALEGNQSRKK